jgi:hypothetical protein
MKRGGEEEGIGVNGGGAKGRGGNHDRNAGRDCCRYGRIFGNELQDPFSQAIADISWSDKPMVETGTGRRTRVAQSPLETVKRRAS